jgi:hypothetical protein
MDPVFDLNQLSAQYMDYYWVLGSTLFNPSFFERIRAGVARQPNMRAIRLSEVGTRGAI